MNAFWTVVLGDFGTVLVSGMAFVGTVMQYQAAVQSINRNEEAAAATFRTIDDLRGEVPLWRPFRRREHKRVVDDMLRNSPAEAAEHARLLRVIASWSLLTAAAAATTFAAVGRLVSDVL